MDSDSMLVFYKIDCESVRMLHFKLNILMFAYLSAYLSYLIGPCIVFDSWEMQIT